MNKSVFLALCAVIAVESVSARQLSAEEAWRNAMGKTESIQTPTRMMSVNSVQAASVSEVVPTLSYTVETDDMPTVYVFTREKGYWVVAANDAVPHGLLGYTDTGVFDADNIPENVDWLLNQYGQQVAYAAALGERYDSAGQTEADHECEGERHCVAPILTTKWGQTSPYNSYCPLYNGQSTPTGCVATGMAQVMYHYRYPEAGTGSVSYTPNSVIGKLTYDFESNPFNWDAMEQASVRPTTAESADAVAQLMYACGMAVSMKYTPAGSSSSCLTASRALVSRFGYDKGAACLSRDYFDLDQWIGILYSEIAAGRPVLYSGTSETDGGHFFVLDGYECGNYFHVNWGWDGGFNGYFIVTALDHRQQSKGFSYNENIIVGVQPALADSEVRPVVQFNGDMTMTKTECLRYNYYTIPIKCATGIFNQSVAKLEGVKLGLRMVDGEGNVRYAETVKTYNLLAGQAIVSYDIRGDQFPDAGRWTIYPAVKTAGGQWYDILVNREGEYAYVLEADGRNLKFMALSEAIAAESVKDIQVTHLSVSSSIIPGETVEIEAVFNNTSANKYTKYLTPTLIAEGSAGEAGTMVTIDLLGNSAGEVEWASTWSGELATGNYRLALIDRKGNTIGTPIEVTVVDEFGTMGMDHIGADDLSEVMRSEVYTLDGTKVADVEGSELTDLRAGTYVIRTTMSDGTVRTEKKMIR